MNDRRRCTAMSKQAGRRCKRAPIPGGTVCASHGGKAPQTRAAARARLALLVDPALVALGQLIKQTRHRPSQLGAARDVLDRNGLGAATKVMVGGRLKLQPAQTRALSNEELGRLLQAAAVGGAMGAALLDEGTGQS